MNNSTADESSRHSIRRRHKTILIILFSNRIAKGHGDLLLVQLLLDFLLLRLSYLRFGQQPLSFWLRILLSRSVGGSPNRGPQANGCKVFACPTSWPLMFEESGPNLGCRGDYR